MKAFAIIMFGFTAGILSSYCGLHVVDEPVKYFFINIPAILCFASTLTVLTEN